MPRGNSGRPHLVKSDDPNETRRRKVSPVASPIYIDVDDPLTQPTPISREDVRSIMREEIGGMLSTLNQNISTLADSVKEELTEMKESLKFFSTKYDDLVFELTASRDLVKNLQDENKRVSSAVVDLQTRLNQLEQYARNSNLEIQCVPENRNENLVSTIVQLGRVVGSDIKEEDIKNCTRIAKLNSSNARPRSIVAEFNSPRARDIVLASVIKFNKSRPNDKLNTSNLGMGGDRKQIYVVEHLSTANKALHAAARLKAKEKCYKYVWVRNGRIFMRKNDNTDCIFVRNLDSLSNLK